MSGLDTHVHLPAGTLVLRHGERAAALDALLEPGASEWAFITAWNPGSRRLSRPENERRQRELVRSISGRYRLYPGAGGGDASGQEAWPAELSVLVLGIPLEEALGLGRAWGQHAILAGTRDERRGWLFATPSKWRKPSSQVTSSPSPVGVDDGLPVGHG